MNTPSKEQYEFFALQLCTNLFVSLEQDDFEDESKARLLVRMFNLLEYKNNQEAINEVKIIQMLKDTNFVSATEIIAVVECGILLSSSAVLNLTKYNAKKAKLSLPSEIEKIIKGDGPLSIFSSENMKNVFLTMKEEGIVLDIQLVDFVLNICSEADDYRTWGNVVKLFISTSDMVETEVSDFLKAIITSYQILDLNTGSIDDFFKKIKKISTAQINELKSKVVCNSDGRIIEVDSNDSESNDSRSGSGEDDEDDRRSDTSDNQNTKRNKTNHFRQGRNVTKVVYTEPSSSSESDDSRSGSGEDDEDQSGSDDDGDDDDDA
jgi:hypothetical protein